MKRESFLRRMICAALCLLLLPALGGAAAEGTGGGKALSAEEIWPEDAEAIEDESKVFTFSLIGDCCIGDQAQLYGYKSGYVYKIGQSGLDYPFSLVADLFAADDLTVANCECSFTERRKSKKVKMAMVSDPEYAQVLSLGNVDICNMANNHTRDFGDKGREDTAENLKALGIGIFYDEILYSTTVKGVKIGFVGYTFPMNDQKLKKYVAGMEQLRAEGCTFVVASAHWGTELGYALDANQKYAVRMIDAGFDMVFGHGSHTCEMIRWYHGKPIFYSLGNFTYGANSNQKDDDTVVAQIRFDIHEDGTMTARDLICIPFKQHRDKDYRPYPIPEEDTEGRMRVWEKLYYNNDKKNYQKHKATPAPSLPESFLTTGYADFRQLPATEE